MWARTIELMLAVWLSISPYVFGHSRDAVLFWVVDHLAAVIVGAAALASFHRRLGRAHLLSLLVAAALVVLPYTVGGDRPPPAYQNYMVVGLLLAMFAIIPSRCEEPPAGWPVEASGAQSRPSSRSESESAAGAEPRPPSP